MGRIRVLIVDDSAAVRRLLARELAADPALEVVASAASGPAALARVAEQAVDVVTLDVEMDGMGGIEALARLREQAPDVPVIMFSAHTRRGDEATIDALLGGAADYAWKPGADRPVADAIRGDLIPKLKAVTARRGRAPAPPAAAPAGDAGRVEVVAIGASTGGPNALQEVLTALPGDLPAPVLVVQHMPPPFTALMAQALDARCALGVAEATPDAPLVAGRALIAPAGWHLAVDGSPPRAVVHQGPPENACRPALDVLLRTVAATYGPRALAVVLTGMGQDGLRGAEAVRAAGGRVIAQDEATSVVWGMPGHVVRAGLASEVLPLGDVAGAIVRAVARRGAPCA
ncbi:MAG: chemotaxis-specific protein-glutamate methyltransferase CheB [Planctomycetes bacterium]|nr:chemotaxis-specific protein-glutamate methyltransferase CheB [Planctomycetota bacterium]